MPYIDLWFEPEAPNDDSVCVLIERDEGREAAFELLSDSVMDHLIGGDLLDRLDFPVSASAIRNRLPTRKRIRSGDFAEIVATDYVLEKTTFEVPIKRLRFKDDREMSMRGDDVIGIDRSQPEVRVLRVEVKSRSTLSDGVVGEACAALDGNDGRPKASTLGFISMMLRRSDEDALALIVEKLQETDVDGARVSHLVVTVSGNDPRRFLENNAAPPQAVAARRFVGARIVDHSQFIERVFEHLNARNA